MVEKIEKLKKVIQKMWKKRGEAKKGWWDEVCENSRRKLRECIK